MANSNCKTKKLQRIDKKDQVFRLHTFTIIHNPLLQKQKVHPLMTKMVVSRISLSLHFILTLFVVTRYFRVKYQLTSPFIPLSTLNEIAKPFFFDLVVMGGTFAVSLSLYFFSKNLLSIVISAFSFIYIIIYY